MSVEDFREMARRESEASRKAWAMGDDFEPIARPSGKTIIAGSVADRLIPYVGSGLSQSEVASILGCTRGPIVKACKRLGINWKAGTINGRAVS